jgi:2',3'-cyclic-nucleotide 2'-phosphodiesterase (5'-nucleotidase family)
MTRVLSLGALSVSLLALSAGQAAADYTLHILHINDWHSRIEATIASSRPARPRRRKRAKMCFARTWRGSSVTAVNDRRARPHGPQNTQCSTAATIVRARSSTPSTRARCGESRFL